MRKQIEDITFLDGNSSAYNTNDILVWKSDCSDFGTGSVVTVYACKSLFVGIASDD